MDWMTAGCVFRQNLGRLVQAIQGKFQKDKRAMPLFFEDRPSLDHRHVGGRALVTETKHLCGAIARERASYPHSESGQYGSSKTVVGGKAARGRGRERLCFPIASRICETSRLGVKPALMALVIFSLVSCQREEMSYYEIPKEQSQAQLAEAGDSQLPPGHPEIPAVTRSNDRTVENPTWSTPAHWRPGKPSQLRRASFSANGTEGERVDISITTFPGQVGGALANINRWRRQIGLGPITEDEVDEVMSELEINGHQYRLIDIANESRAGDIGWPQSSVIATRAHQGNSWFFKMSGDQPLVDQEREAFLQFLGSVEFERR